MAAAAADMITVSAEKMANQATLNSVNTNPTTRHSR